MSNSNYDVILTNKKPYPSKLTDDYMLSKIDVVKNNRRLSYMSGIPVELWLSLSGSWVKYNDATTGRYGNCIVRTSTNYITSYITNCTGYAVATIHGVAYTSNLIRYNFFGGPSNISYEIDAHSGVVDRSSFDIFDGDGRTDSYDRMPYS